MPLPLPSSRHRRPTSANGLWLPDAPERLAALQAEGDRLLKKIALKQKDLEALLRGIEDATRALSRGHAARDEALRLDQALHGLFDELLGRKRRHPAGARRMIRFVYEMLLDVGVISARPAKPPGAGAEGEDSDADRFDDFHDGDPDFSSHGSGGGAGGFSARRPGDAPEDQTLRGLFRRLALAIHPDRVADEGEKVRRTELMKEISRAYQERDLARLMNLERTWTREGNFVPESDELGRKCAHVERANEALRAQLKAVVTELKELRRSPRAQLFREWRLAEKRGDPDPIAAMIAAGDAEVAQMREVLEFVESFRDGKITLTTFVRGPDCLRGTGEPDPFDGGDAGDAGAFVDFFEQRFEGARAAPPPRRRGRSRGAPGRAKNSVRDAKGRPGDIPF